MDLREVELLREKPVAQFTQPPDALFSVLMLFLQSGIDPSPSGRKCSPHLLSCISGAPKLGLEPHGVLLHLLTWIPVPQLDCCLSQTI